MRIEPLYPLRHNTENVGARWWYSDRQRVLILTFDSVAEAEAWDENPTTEGLLIKP